MKRLLYSLVFLFILSPTIQGQDYKTGIGFRGGTQNGLTIKQFVGEKSALEGIFATRWEGFYAIGLYERVGSYLQVPGFMWVYGVGAHVGISWRQQFPI